MPLPFFRGRKARRPREWAFHASGGHVVPPAPVVWPHDLIGVIGSGTTVNAGGIGLTLLSVERYEEGVVALFRLLRQRGRFEREFPNPHLDLTVTPANAEPYRVWQMGSSGGGRDMTEIEYRMNYAIVPGPPSDANEIVIDVREIAWERFGEGTNEVLSKNTGPWRFSVKL